MDADSFLDALESETQTELSRLGSSKALYADTRGEMDEPSVRRAAADRAHAASETFESWTDDASGDAVSLFDSTATRERDHRETLADGLDDYEPDGPPAVQAALRECSGSVERAGGFVGWALSAGKHAEQLVGFFVGQASPQVAQSMREVRDDHESALEDGLDLLASVCDGDDDWENALDAAGRVIEADYTAYVETLESLGVNPKPVC
jgi:hypothetical protein